MHRSSPRARPHSMAVGQAGVQNPLFFRAITQMLFGDAKTRVDDINHALAQLPAPVTT